MSRLTPQQTEIVKLLAEGWTVREIAAELDLSRSTVRDVIRFLRDYYGCEQHELPAKTGVVA